MAGKGAKVGDRAQREAARERGKRTSFNGADGISDIEGKAAREAASEFQSSSVRVFWSNFSRLRFVLLRD